MKSEDIEDFGADNMQISAESFDAIMKKVEFEKTVIAIEERFTGIKKESKKYCGTVLNWPEGSFEFIMKKVKVQELKKEVIKLGKEKKELNNNEYYDSFIDEKNKIFNDLYNIIPDEFKFKSENEKPKKIKLFKNNK